MNHYHFDQLGSTRLLTNSAGTVTDEYSYDAYGAVLSYNRCTGSADQPYRYVGRLGYYTHWQEPNFGLLQLGVRFYDSEVGRFTRRDPVDDHKHSRYVYVEDSPTSGVDYDGRATYKIPIEPVSSFKICYRNLFGKCIRHSYLLIDGYPIGYGPGGVGEIPGDVDDLVNGRANCKTLRHLNKSQMSCLRGLRTGNTQVPGNWCKGTVYKRGDGPGCYCPSFHDCFDWTRAALGTCGLAPSIVGDYNYHGNFHP